MLDFQAKDEASSPPNKTSTHTYIRTHGLNKGLTTNEGAQQEYHHSTSAMAPFYWIETRIPAFDPQK